MWIHSTIVITQKQKRRSDSRGKKFRQRFTEYFKELLMAQPSVVEKTKAQHIKYLPTYCSCDFYHDSLVVVDRLPKIWNFERSFGINIPLRKEWSGQEWTLRDGAIKCTINGGPVSVSRLTYFFVSVKEHEQVRNLEEGALLIFLDC